MKELKEVQQLIQRNSDNKDTEGIKASEECASMEEISGNKENITYIDDGRSIADMNIEGFSWYNKNSRKKQQNEITKLDISFKERKAMILGALSVILPMAGLIILLYAGAFLLLSLWLN